MHARTHPHIPWKPSWEVAAAVVVVEFVVAAVVDFVVVLVVASFSRFVAGSVDSNQKTRPGVVELPNIALVGVVEN